MVMAEAESRRKLGLNLLVRGERVLPPGEEVEGDPAQTIADRTAARVQVPRDVRHGGRRQRFELRCRRDNLTSRRRGFSKFCSRLRPFGDDRGLLVTARLDTWRGVSRAFADRAHEKTPPEECLRRSYQPLRRRSPANSIALICPKKLYDIRSGKGRPRNAAKERPLTIPPGTW